MYRILQQVISILNYFLMLVTGVFILIIINNLIRITLKQ
jgi:hypothetical protein